MRIRLESFGAWLGLSDGTLVAITRARARSLGIDGEARWSHKTDTSTAPLEAHVAITSQCAVGCEGCYQNATPNGQHVDLTQLKTTFAELQAQSVFTVALGGGEPLSHPDLHAIATLAREHQLTVVVTTSGIGLREDHDLSAFSQINVSHDGVAGSYEAVRGVNASSHAETAIAALVAKNIRVGINYVLTRDSFAHLEETLAHVASLGVVEVQLLRYKPAGRAASVDYLAKRLSPSQVSALPKVIEQLTQTFQGKVSVRIDCALVPFLSQSSLTASQLERWGVFGCEAGRHLVAITQNGQRKPCSFAHDIPENLFHDYVANPSEPCTSCHLRAVCRGGCKIVSHYLEGTVSQDPECPRVRAHRSGLPLATPSEHPP